MKNSPIEWTGDTWPVVNGCRRVSPGCGGKVGEGGCYAERLISTRLRHMPKYKELAVFDERGPHWTGESRLWVPDLDIPLRTRKPTTYFVANMGDLFFEEVTDEEIAVVFGVMASCPRHTFQVLTKRAKRMRKWFENTEAAAMVANQTAAEHVQRRAYAHDVAIQLHAIKGTIKSYPWPLQNVHLGISVENQKYADERIPELLRTPAVVRFVSYEPALGPVDFTKDGWLHDMPVAPGDSWRPGLDWIIYGTESGPGARGHDIAWAESARDQCAANKVAFFTKQISTPGHPKGGDPAFWPPGNWPRQFPRGAS